MQWLGRILEGRELIAFPDFLRWSLSLPLSPSLSVSLSVCVCLCVLGTTPFLKAVWKPTEAKQSGLRVDSVDEDKILKSNNLGSPQLLPQRLRPPPVVCGPWSPRWSAQDPHPHTEGSSLGPSLHILPFLKRTNFVSNDAFEIVGESTTGEKIGEASSQIRIRSCVWIFIFSWFLNGLGPDESCKI